jgi:hypothetical protein
MFFFVSMFLVAAGSELTAQNSQRPVYNGHWWLSVSQEERLGFVSGYVDCYMFEYKGPAGFWNRSGTVLRDLMTEYYESVGNADESVPSVLGHFRDRPTDTVPPAMPGPIKFGPHGGMDGQLWWEINGNGPDEPLGIVEGYLHCHETQSRNEGGVFSKTPDEYRLLINEWYELDVETGDINSERVWEKIADVLFGFRDGAEGHGS